MSGPRDKREGYGYDPRYIPKARMEMRGHATEPQSSDPRVRKILRVNVLNFSTAYFPTKAKQS